jgi:hypothetical protein
MNGRNLGPITPHGSVVVNVAFDSNLYATKSNPKNQTPWPSRTPSDLIVAKGELVFRYLNGSKRKRAAYNEPDLKVFSTANGFPEATNNDMELYRKSVSFIGVSNGDLVPGPSKHTSVTVAGLITIKNTGPYTIHAGEKIVWDFPSIGGNHKRACFLTLPHSKAYGIAYGTGTDSSNVSMGTEWAKKVTDGVRPEDDSCSGMCANDFKKLCKTTYNKDDQGALAKFANRMSQMTREVDSRIVGTALSDAGPNEAMDVLIRYGK